MNKTMKKRMALGIAGFVAAILLVMAAGGLYVVSEMEQAVITQFGEIVDVVQEPGLHVKTPFVQKVNYFDKRILEWDGEAKQIPTRGKKFITVDSWARWRIVDPKKFFQSVTTEAQGHAVLDDRIESALRDSVSSLMLEETVRSSSNREMQYVTEEIKEAQDVKTDIDVGRDQLVVDVLNSAQTDLKEDYGIELVDVQLKRLNYIERVRQDVYKRMQSERQRIAEKYLSEARSTENTILGEMQRELDQIESDGYRQAETIKGQADAEAASIYAEAYSQEPEFFGFMRKLESYEKTLDENTFLLLSTESDYFDLLQGNLPELKSPETSPDAIDAPEDAGAVSGSTTESGTAGGEE